MSNLFNSPEDSLIQRERITNRQLLNGLNSILKKWWLFVLVGLIAGILGILYAGLKKPYYESRLTFALDQGEGGGMSGALSLAAQFGLNISSSKDIFGGDNILEIITSRRMVETVLLSTDTFNNKPFTLVEYYLEINGGRNARTSNIHFPIGQPRSEFSYLQDSLLYVVANRMIVLDISARRPDKKTSIYEVNVSSDDEKFAKIFTDRLVSETNNFYIEMCSKKSRETMEILQQRAGFMKGNIDTSLTTRAYTQDVNINPAFAAAQVPVLKQQMNIQLYGAAYGEIYKNLELARYNYLKKIPLMQIIDPADYPMKKVKASKLKGAINFALVAELLLIIFFFLKELLRNRKNLTGFSS